MALPTLKHASPVPIRSAAAQGSSWQQDMKQTTPRIDVKFPILGFLMDSEATGYDLKRRFGDPVGFFYRVSDGSLYPALKKLARDGLVTQRVERHGKRSRKVYAITDAGRALFLRMLREPAQPVFVFDEAQVKIYFAHHDPATALTHMKRTQQEDSQHAEMLRWLAHEMEKNGESVFRKALIEVGYAVTHAKAKVFARLFNQVKSKIALEERARARQRTARAAG